MLGEEQLHCGGTRRGSCEVTWKVFRKNATMSGLALRPWISVGFAAPPDLGRKSGSRPGAVAQVARVKFGVILVA